MGVNIKQPFKSQKHILFLVPYIVDANNVESGDDCIVWAFAADYI